MQSSTMSSKRVRGVDSIRMHKAVSARLSNPNLSLFDALCIGGFEYAVDDDSCFLHDNSDVTLGQRKDQLARCLRLARRIITSEMDIPPPVPPPVLPRKHNGYNNINVTTRLPSMNVGIYCNMRFSDKNQQYNLDAHQGEFLHHGIQKLVEVPSSGFVEKCPSSQPFKPQFKDTSCGQPIQQFNKSGPSPVMAFSSLPTAPRRPPVGMIPQHKLIPPLELSCPSSTTTGPSKFVPEMHGSESASKPVATRQEPLALDIDIDIDVDILSYHGDDDHPQADQDGFDQINFLPISSDYTIQYGKGNTLSCADNGNAPQEYDDDDSLFAFDDVPPLKANDYDGGDVTDSAPPASYAPQVPKQNRRISLLSDDLDMHLPPPPPVHSISDPVTVFPGVALKFFPTKKEAAAEKKKQSLQRQQQRAISPDNTISAARPS